MKDPRNGKFADSISCCVSQVRDHAMRKREDLRLIVPTEYRTFHQHFRLTKLKVNTHQNAFVYTRCSIRGPSRRVWLGLELLHHHDSTSDHHLPGYLPNLHSDRRIRLPGAHTRARYWMHDRGVSGHVDDHSTMRLSLHSCINHIL